MRGIYLKSAPSLCRECVYIVPEKAVKQSKTYYHCSRLYAPCDVAKNYCDYAPKLDALNKHLEYIWMYNNRLL